MHTVSSSGISCFPIAHGLTLISPLAAAVIIHIKLMHTHTNIKKLEGAHTLWYPQREAGQSSGATWLLGTCLFIPLILNGPALGHGDSVGQDTPILSSRSFSSRCKYKGKLQGGMRENKECKENEKETSLTC